MRARVLWYIRQCGEKGATDDQCQRWLDMNPSTQRPRRIKLVSDGLVRDSGRKRETASGAMAVVWVAA
jgi:hypothetical protein